jgi:hypothetical protein
MATLRQGCNPIQRILPPLNKIHSSSLIVIVKEEEEDDDDDDDDDFRDMMT